MWSEVNENIQETDAEQDIIGRVHELKEQGDTINEHIDQVMEGAPTKLKVTVNMSDDDWEKMQKLHNHGWNRRNRCLPTNTNSRKYYGKSRATDLLRL